MKLLISLLLILSTTSACLESRDDILYEMGMKEHPLLAEVPRFNRCRELVELGWKVKDKECLKHIEKPKYKIGRLVKVKSNKYYGKCTFEVVRPDWNGVLNEPEYYGTLTCNGKNQTDDDKLRDNGKLLSDYKKGE